MFGAPIGLQSWEWLPSGAQRGGPAAASVSRGIKKKSRRGVRDFKVIGFNRKENRVLGEDSEPKLQRGSVRLPVRR